MLKKLAYTCVGVLLTFNCANAFAEETLHFVRIKGLAEQAIGEKLLKEIYKRANIPITITAMPGKRAIAEASSGKKHGETLRIFALGEKVKTLIRVPTPLSELNTAAFAKQGRDIKIEKKEDLNKYSSVVVRGVLHTRDYTKGLKKVSKVDDPAVIFPFVQKGRADIALTSNLDGRAVLKKSGINNIKLVAPKLKTLKLYHYIHESKSDLVPKIDAIIKDMAASGELEKIRSKLELEYIENIKSNSSS